MTSSIVPRSSPSAAARVSTIGSTTPARRTPGSVTTNAREPLAAAILADFEQVRYDAALARPDEKRYELKTLFNF